jgi:glycosyltransferase involved in cell wall biosynthesis
MNLPSFSVIIPAFNAQDTIGALLGQLKKKSPAAAEVIFVINDGSTDKTSQIAKSMGVRVLDLTVNKGKGHALRKGIELFLTETESDYVLFMDADLQHPPSSIKSFLDKANNTDSLVLIGKRTFKIGQMPFLRYLSNKITSFILSKITHQNIKDSQCGFRLIKRDTLKNINVDEEGFQYESAFILKCARENIQIDFANIPTIYNNYGSSISHFDDTYKFCKLIFKEIIKR